MAIISNKFEVDMTNRSCDNDADALTWQAFTADEMTVAKTRVERLQRLQATVSEAWRQVRWTADVIAQARDRSRGAGFLQLRTLFGDGLHTTTTMTHEACARDGKLCFD